MIRRRVTMDLSALPTNAFGVRDLMAWGTMGFIIIEGFTLVVCAFVYLYLTKNFSEWPPAGTMHPSVIVPTIHTVFMLLTLALMRWIDRVAHDRNLERVRLGLTLACAASLAMVLLRAWELTRSLNVRWDANAYGSVQWLIVGSHGTLLAVQLIEVFGMAAIFWLGPVEKKHFSDAADIAFYWMFIVVAWIPLYLLCYLVPHWV